MPSLRRTRPGSMTPPSVDPEAFAEAFGVPDLGDDVHDDVCRVLGLLVYGEDAHQTHDEQEH